MQELEEGLALRLDFGKLPQGRRGGRTTSIPVALQDADTGEVLLSPTRTSRRCARRCARAARCSGRPRAASSGARARRRATARASSRCASTASRTRSSTSCARRARASATPATPRRAPRARCFYRRLTSRRKRTRIRKDGARPLLDRTSAADAGGLPPKVPGTFLAALVARRALLEEGAHALAVVLGAEELGEGAAHPVAEALPVGIERFAQAGLEARGRRAAGSRRSARASASASGRRSACGTTRDTRPMRSASRGVDHLAGEEQLGGASRGRRGRRGAPSPATSQQSPRSTKSSPNFARSDATRRSPSARAPCPSRPRRRSRRRSPARRSRAAPRRPA